MKYVTPVLALLRGCVRPVLALSVVFATIAFVASLRTLPPEWWVLVTGVSAYYLGARSAEKQNEK